MEVLLEKNDSRFVLFPIQHNDIWQAYKAAEASFWTAEEIDLSNDMSDWKKLNDNEKHFIKNVLAFFAASDGIVGENLAQKFYSEVQIPEARCFFGFQIMMENIHSETYSLLIDSYINNEVEKSHLLHAIQTIPAVKKKAEWALKWINNTDSFAERLVAFAAVEGIFFSSSFCSIYWLKHRGLMHGLSFSNELISRDEGMHTDFASLLYSKLNSKLNTSTINKIIEEAVEIEIEFCTDSLPVELIGMNSSLMTTYVKFVADRLLTSFGYDKIYNVRNPFDFMEKMSLNNKTNFFEKKVAEYTKSGVGKTAEDNQIKFDAEF